jgi:hypothetical protein
MPQIKVLLMRKGLEPISAEFQYDQRDLPPHILEQSVSVSVGEESANAIVTLPLDILTLVMGRVMAKAGSQSSKLVVPKPPSIVMPN